MLAFTIAQAAPAFDPDSVTPGVIGFAATAVVAVAVCFLLFDMNRRVRRVKYREEVRAEIAAEQAGTAQVGNAQAGTAQAGTEEAAADEAVVGGEQASAAEADVATSPSTPTDEERTER